MGRREGPKGEKWGLSNKLVFHVFQCSNKLKSRTNLGVSVEHAPLGSCVPTCSTCSKMFHQPSMR
jgi:hypothetical protein